MWRAAVLIPIFLMGCTGKYYDSVHETNETIAIENTARAQACADAIIVAKGDPAAIVAISLTVCKGIMPLITPAEPERVSDIIKSTGTAVFTGSSPWALVEALGRVGDKRSVEIGGDSVGGDSKTSTEYPVEVVTP